VRYRKSVLLYFLFHDEMSKLKFFRQKGIVINTADGKRNIAFRVKTINTMFATVCESIASSEEAKKIM